MRCTRISLSYMDKKKPLRQLQNEAGIDRRELERLLRELDGLMRIGCGIDGEEVSLALEVEFAADRAAFIGWIDEFGEETWYYDNGSGDTESVPLLINECPQGRLLCRSAEEIAAIILHFCETGERYPGCSWIADEEL